MLRALSLALLFVRPVEAQDQGIAEGKALLAALVVAQRDMAQMTAEYVQYRTTPLTSKPLVARGTLAFRREPGCVVFRVREPREAVIRLDHENYEVWHPDRQQLERFVLPNDEMPRLLFDALAPRQADLERGFAITSCVPVADNPTLRRITLLPTGADTKRVATRITLTIDAETEQLCGFGYQDPRGGDVRVELSAVKLAAKADDTLFTLDVPKGTRVLVQRVPEPAPAEGERKREPAPPNGKKG